TDPSPTCISTLPLHDALPICATRPRSGRARPRRLAAAARRGGTLLCPLWHAHPAATAAPPAPSSSPPTVERGATTRSSRPSRPRSEEHTSELQSRENLVCRLL